MKRRMRGEEGSEDLRSVGKKQKADLTPLSFDLSLTKTPGVSRPALGPTAADPNMDLVRQHITMQLAGGGFFRPPVGPTLGLTTVQPPVVAREILPQIKPPVPEGVLEWIKQVKDLLFMLSLPDVLVGIDSPVGGVETKLPFSRQGDITTTQRGPSINVPLPLFGSVASFGVAVNQRRKTALLRGSVSTPFGGVAGSLDVNELSARATILGPTLNLPLGFGVNAYIRWSLPFAESVFGR